MNDPLPKNQNASTENDSATGFSLFSNWLSLYIFVLAIFAIVVLLLTWFSRAFS